MRGGSGSPPLPCGGVQQGLLGVLQDSWARAHPTVEDAREAPGRGLARGPTPTGLPQALLHGRRKGVALHLSQGACRRPHHLRGRGEHRQHGLKHRHQRGLQGKQEGIGTGVEGVGQRGGPPGARAQPVPGLHELHHGVAQRGPVLDRGHGGEAGRVQALGLVHGDRCEAGEVPGQNRGVHIDHALGDQGGSALLHVRRGRGRELLARCAGDVLLGAAANQDQHLHLGPVRGGCALHGQGVRAVRGGPHQPLHEAPVEAAAGAAGSYPGNRADPFGDVEQLAERKNQAAVPACRGSHPRSRGEVVHRHHPHLHRGVLWLAPRPDIPQDVLHPCTG
eukprot:RCo049992